MRSLLLWVVVVMVFPQSARAYDFYSRAQKKQEAKDAKRWSLSQWMEQKRNNRLMDTWLMYNAPSPYEFFLGVDTASVQRDTLINDIVTQSQSYRTYRGHMAAFVTLVGLYGEYEKSNEILEQWKALFMFRILGSSDQSTHLTAHYGLMGREDQGEKSQHQVGGGRFNFYLIRAFAVHGLYEYILEAETDVHNTIEGHRIEAGAHIEYGALRIYGSWFSENLKRVDTLNQETHQRREGILFGTRIYF